MAAHAAHSAQPPARQTGIVTGQDLALCVSNEIPFPTLFDDNMVIVKVRAVAINPTDFKMPAAFPSAGAVDGCDFAGEIFSLGPSVSRWRLGDRVFGAVQGANPQNHQSGAFQEFVPTYEGEVLRIPDDMSFEMAASIGGACIGTAAVALYCSLGLEPLPQLLKAGDKPELQGGAKDVLVYGGSTNTGAMAIQLIKL
jgi:NADPH:quinone reductase-like Zn-dependent oxidoreductase